MNRTTQYVVIVLFAFFIIIAFFQKIGIFLKDEELQSKNQKEITEEFEDIKKEKLVGEYTEIDDNNKTVKLQIKDSRNGEYIALFTGGNFGEGGRIYEVSTLYKNIEFRRSDDYNEDWTGLILSYDLIKIRNNSTGIYKKNYTWTFKRKGD